MQFEGALVKEQGISFAIVVVKQYVILNRFESQKAYNAFQPHFPGLPLILMAQDLRGIPQYYGRRDIVNFLSKVPMERIPWKRFNISAVL